VEDLVLTDDRALQSGGDPDQMPYRLLTRFNLEASVHVWHGAEPVQLHAMAGAEQDPVRVTANPRLHRLREPLALICAHSVGMNGHHPGF
jgi:hypothetical protein